MKLAIVGSILLDGNPRAKELIEKILDKYNPTNVVSGGAIGIDSMAEAAAARRGIPTIIFRPTTQAWAAPGGYRERNEQIAQTCDVLVRIASRRTNTYGSGWTRDRAIEMGKPTEEFIL